MCHGKGKWPDRRGGPALVIHYFGTKEALFIAAARQPARHYRLLGNQAALRASPRFVTLRHVIRVEPLATASPDDIVALVSPAVERYLR